MSEIISFDPFRILPRERRELMEAAYAAGMGVEFDTAEDGRESVAVYLPGDIWLSYGVIKERGRWEAYDGHGQETASAPNARALLNQLRTVEDAVTA